MESCSVCAVASGSVRGFPSARPSRAFRRSFLRFAWNAVRPIALAPARLRRSWPLAALARLARIAPEPTQTAVSAIAQPALPPRPARRA